MLAKRKRHSIAPASTNRPLPPAKNRPPPSASPTVPNLLLAALPLDDYKQLAPTLELVSPKLKDILHKPGEPLQHGSLVYALGCVDEFLNSWPTQQPSSEASESGQKSEDCHGRRSFDAYG